MKFSVPDSHKQSPIIAYPLLTSFEELYVKNKIVIPFDYNLLLVRHINKLADNFAYSKNREKLLFSGKEVRKDKRNLLFVYFMKFSVGFYQLIHLNKELEASAKVVDEMMVQEYVFKQLNACLTKEKYKLFSKEVKTSDIIRNVCVKERLTVYNFLRMTTNFKDEFIKDRINNLYFETMKLAPEKIEKIASFDDYLEFKE